MSKQHRIQSATAFSIVLALWAAPGGRAHAATAKDFCRESTAAVALFGAASYKCLARVEAKVFRLEGVVLEPAQAAKKGALVRREEGLGQDGVFWAGAIGFAMASSASGAAAGDWVYEGRLSSDPFACASIGEADAKALAVSFGRAARRMSGPDFAAKAWPRFSKVACGSTRAQRPQPAALGQAAGACASARAWARADRLDEDYACVDTAEGPMHPMASMAPGSLGRVFGFAASASGLVKSRPNASVIVQPYPGFDPSVCVRVPVGRLAPLAAMMGGGMKMEGAEAATAAKQMNKLMVDIEEGTRGLGAYLAACPGYAKPSTIDVQEGSRLGGAF